MTHDLFQSKLIRYKELQQLNTSLKKQSKSGDSDFWTSLAIQANKGLFKDMGAFEGLLKAVAVRAEREASGKALNGMRFNSYFNSFLTTMTAMSPAAAKYLRNNFAGQSLRNMRHQQKINGGHIEDGIVMANFKRVAGYIKDLGYTGPLALASDQTVCVKSLRSHNGYINVGAQGGDVPFSDLEELSNLVKDITLNNKLCSKVPLPKFPLFVVALVASYKKETAEDIAASHLLVLNYCSQSGMSIISIGSDGAASEILALCMVQSLSKFHSLETLRSLSFRSKTPSMPKKLQPISCFQAPDFCLLESII
ncbi:hypothetical protein PCANC_04824 [Puccinia coronata f. sp. avenae]|uniref:Uncharacterized protein n=1 Tax=Puccinia coronata f. sp. avenae TaxID=200324 RepID=A0A2N5T2F3_9BASI|nr:hypothetical protein PCANC_08918 [Puccinia coronata f. sp. avenae]PLW56480.1 hypothetical protein PCANC_04824 [Puccinia coronata f. sp. avenae]